MVRPLFSTDTALGRLVRQAAMNHPMTTRIAGVLIRTGDLRHTRDGTAENFSAVFLSMSREVGRTFEAHRQDRCFFCRRRTAAGAGVPAPIQCNVERARIRSLQKNEMR